MKTINYALDGLLEIKQKLAQQDLSFGGLKRLDQIEDKYMAILSDALVEEGGDGC